MSERKTTSWFITLPPEGAARQVAMNAAQAFADLGVRHKVFDCGKHAGFFRKLMVEPADETMVTDLVNHALAVQCLDFGATRLLVCALSPVTLFTLNLLRRQNVCTVHWFYEDYRRAAYWTHVAAGYDIFACVQRGPLEAAVRDAGCRYLLLQTAAVFADQPPQPAAPACDAAFVGFASPYRIEVLELLVRNGIRCAVAGSGWQGYDGPLKPCIVCDTWIDETRARELLSSVKIGINLSIEDPRENPADAQLSPRIFEILYAGAELLTEDTPLVHETLGECGYETFRSAMEALAKARTLLESYDRTSRRRVQNRRIIHAYHTYRNRVGELLAFAG